MSRKTLTPEAKAEAEQALQAVMRKFCEDVERAKAERDADEMARAMVRLADEMGANV